MAYEPGFLGTFQDPKMQELAVALAKEFGQIARAFVEVDSLTLVELNNEPRRLYTGLTVLADGTNWDPGDGQGVYTYFNNQWNKLGTLESLKQYVRDEVQVAIYGGMRTIGTSGSYSLGGGWTKYTDFNAQSVTPKRMTFDTSTNTFQFNENGIYLFFLSFSFDHNESNQGRNFQIRLFNETDSVQISEPVIIGVGRNTPATNFSFQFLVDLSDLNEDDDIAVQLGNGSSVTGTFDSFEIGACSVAELQGIPVPFD